MTPEDVKTPNLATGRMKRTCYGFLRRIQLNKRLLPHDNQGFSSGRNSIRLDRVQRQNLVGPSTRFPKE